MIVVYEPRRYCGVRRGDCRPGALEGVGWLNVMLGAAYRSGGLVDRVPGVEVFGDVLRPELVGGGSTA